jgi:hypothetical protein
VVRSDDAAEPYLQPRGDRLAAGGLAGLLAAHVLGAVAARAFGADLARDGLPARRGGVLVVGRQRRQDCPGRKPPFLAVKRPARPYKSAIEKRFT